MIRSSVLFATVILAFLTPACDKTASGQRQGVTVQNPVNDKSAGTDTDVVPKAKNAELEAGQ